jgi:hypothetical protein
LARCLRSIRRPIFKNSSKSIYLNNMIVKYKYKSNTNIIAEMKIARRNEKAPGKRRLFLIIDS